MPTLLAFGRPICPSFPLTPARKGSGEQRNSHQSRCSRWSDWCNRQPGTGSSAQPSKLAPDRPVPPGAEDLRARSVKASRPPSRRGQPSAHPCPRSAASRPRSLVHRDMPGVPGRLPGPLDQWLPEVVHLFHQLVSTHCRSVHQHTTIFTWQVKMGRRKIRKREKEIIISMSLRSPHAREPLPCNASLCRSMCSLWPCYGLVMAFYEGRSRSKEGTG